MLLLLLLLMLLRLPGVLLLKLLLLLAVMLKLVVLGLVVTRGTLRSVSPGGGPLVVLDEREPPRMMELRHAAARPARRERTLLTVGLRALALTMVVATACREEGRLVPAPGVAGVRAVALVHRRVVGSGAHRHGAVNDGVWVVWVAIRHASGAEDSLLWRAVSEVPPVGVGLHRHLFAAVLKDREAEVVFAVGLGAMDAVARADPHLVRLLVRARLTRHLVRDVSGLLDDGDLL
mmetsp:Transcript_22616/g.42486  ORF Transcript_22616/g.42486 Transcript_22616/m.42486 type:complete len:234 (-) Transcript_22616:198-899(-)